MAVSASVKPRSPERAAAACVRLRVVIVINLLVIDLSGSHGRGRGYWLVKGTLSGVPQPLKVSETVVRVVSFDVTVKV